MSIKLNYLKKIGGKTSNLVLFCDEKYSTSGLKKYLSNPEFTYINDLLKTTSKDPSAYLRGPGLICLNVANSLRLFFFANL